MGAAVSTIEPPRVRGAETTIGTPPRPAAALSPLARQPTVSIVIPCHNPNDRLDLALRSLQEQTYSHLELIAVDAASTDGTVERLQAQQRNGLRLISEPDDGQADAICKGFDAARGDVLAWLNADDVLLPDAVERWVEMLGHESKPAVAYGGCYEWFEDVGWMVPAPWVHRPNYATLRDQRDYIMQPAACFRAEAYREVGGLDRALHFAMDWDLWLGLSERWPVAYTPEVLAINRVHADTKTRQGGLERIREIRQVGKRHGRSQFAPANHRYGLVALSERITTVGWLRNTYKDVRTRLNLSAEANHPARLSETRIRSLPLDQPRSLWLVNPKGSDRLETSLHGGEATEYTVHVDGKPTELCGCDGRYVAAVPNSNAICRRLDLPAMSSAQLLRVALLTEAETLS